jgi:hypothetical protein
MQYTEYDHKPAQYLGVRSPPFKGPQACSLLCGPAVGVALRSLGPWLRGNAHEREC